MRTDLSDIDYLAFYIVSSDSPVVSITVANSWESCDRLMEVKSNDIFNINKLGRLKVVKIKESWEISNGSTLYERSFICKEVSIPWDIGMSAYIDSIIEEDFQRTWG
jgi:hypothetical protein